MNALKKILKKKNKSKGQTALEYALVVGAVSLVIMAAWNIVGKQVQDGIQNSLAPKINDYVTKGNTVFKK